MHLILIFEDDQAIQNILKMLFEANGFRVVIANTAARGEHGARLEGQDEGSQDERRRGANLDWAVIDACGNHRITLYPVRARDPVP